MPDAYTPQTGQVAVEFGDVIGGSEPGGEYAAPAFCGAETVRADAAPASRPQTTNAPNNATSAAAFGRPSPSLLPRIMSGFPSLSYPVAVGRFCGAHAARRGEIVSTLAG